MTKKNNYKVYIISLTNKEIYKEYQQCRKEEMASNNYFIKMLINLYKERRKNEKTN